MRAGVLAVAAMLMFPALAGAQGQRTGRIETERANQHYKRGWDSVRAEVWTDAVREFQQAIDNDPKFALAYYSLGRAHMGQREFGKAIAAYTRCRELFQSEGGEQFTNKLDAQQRLNDRILEYQAALNQATNTKTNSQSQSLYVRELRNQIQRLENARDLNTNVTLQSSGVPFYVSMALGAAYFRNNQFADAEREYKAALEANAASGETHNNLAVLYLLSNRIPEAESEVKAAEAVGYKVNENLKSDILKKKRAGG
jgi:tetratricopeptide (TPR) repeat protein